jgi:E3 ubiquitin-protein ligase BRE1
MLLFAQLNSTLKEKESEITKLSQKQLPNDVAVKLESLQSTLSQLQSSQAQNAELQIKLETTEQRWSQSLGNEKAAVAALSELVNKFNKRWLELTSFSKYNASTETTGATTEHIEANAETLDSATPLSATNSILPLDQDALHRPFVIMSHQITELQHKLNQAMENVRQAELSRDNLKMALNMNSSLQAKLDEMKAKYAALQASRGSSGGKTTVSDATDTGNSVLPVANNSGSPGDDAVTSVVSDSTRTADTVGEMESTPESSAKASSSSKERIKSTTSHKEKSGAGSKSNESRSSSSHAKASLSSSEKLHREYRRVRKELTALTTSHSTLMANNVRLLKQITEKDEMNAKSLSTILHLKSMTEKLIEERDTLELQLKSTNQLALVARLATNAKERVSEELLKEKKVVDDRLAELEKQLHTTQMELHRITTEWSTSSCRMSAKEAELCNVVQRSHALVEENEQKREEIRKLVDIVSKTEREARDAKEKLIHFTKSSNDAAGDSGGDSSFTIDQLKTQVSVLKNRLACPVCHYRDKECIILRCRHMHCKQCVEERVSNRSRKCPTCNVKFAENEVETIFLS